MSMSTLEDSMMDPRECTYRLLATSKLRKQIERLIRTKRIEYGLMEPKIDHADFYSQFSTSTNTNDNTSKTGTVLVNRNAKNKDKEPKDDDNDDQDQEDGGDTQNDDDSRIQAKWIAQKIEKIEDILNRTDENKKQAFTYDDMTQLHMLLQHLDDQDQTGAQIFFSMFMETNFRLQQPPERRQNATLDERLRKLKYKAANDYYDSMVANVAHYVIGKTGKNHRSKILSFGDEFRQVRSTLMATVNALMVIGATFLFFYMAIGYSRPDYDTGKIVLYSFIASMVVAVAEVYFLIRII